MTSRLATAGLATAGLATAGLAAAALGSLLFAAGCAGSGHVGDTGSAGAGGPGSAGNSGSAGSTQGSAGNGGPGTGGSSAGTAGSTGTAGSGNPNFTLNCAGPSRGRPFVRLLTGSELQNTLTDIFPEVKGQWTLSLPSPTISSHGFDNDGSAMVGAQLAGAYVDTALSLATALVGTPLATILPCSTSTADHACAETFLNKYGRRLFRRPITTAEHDKYLAFFDASKTKSDFKTALKWMTVALIQSPNALYRSEVGADSGGGMRQLSAYEVATELAYTFTGTTPTDSLLTMAASGNLGDTTALAKTMLGTDAGKQTLHRFFDQYLGYSGVTSVTKPNISNFATVAPDMVQETRAFINQVVFTNGGGLKDLLTATTTNPSKALATYYGTGNMYTGGFPSPSTDYASVTRPATTGIGVLAQGAFLATHAGSDVSSPTKRGLFTYYKLFCRQHLMPPPNVPQLDTTTVMTGINTTRDRYEKLHAAGSCASCHTQFDPIGFGFEHFDEGGRYRVKEKTFDINSTGSINAPDGSTITFTDETSLMTAVANQPIIHECMSAYLAAYAYGSDEACLGASQVTALQSGSIGIAEAYARLASEMHFTQRSSQ
jgi:hypothetical protein